jgi:RHS repeat-associated protein
MLSATVISELPASAATPQRLRPQAERVVPGRDAPPVTESVARTGKPVTGRPPVWPAGGEAVVDLSAGTARRADGLPVVVDRGRGADGRAVTGPAAPAKVRIQVLDQRAAEAAGVRGLLLRVSRADGTAATGRARVSVDYAAFRDAYGADWSTRLRLVELCAVDSPKCTPKPVISTNDVAAGTVMADVDVTAEGTMFAVAAGSSGAAGDYGATSLQPSATWTAGGSSGDFSWSYPVRVPPAIGGPAPQVSFAYSAQAVDGRMAASNNQPSWLGEGFEWSPGFIERKYQSCGEDMAGGNNSTKTGDQCWATDNATISLNGRGGDLVFEAGKGWRLRSDDGSRIERRTGGVNGDNDGEHWVVTTADGTQYWFGRNRLPGWAAGKAETSSVLTSPVYGNHAGEPCHASSFASSSCTQAYRWNLDYVVDPHGNTTSYWYAKETNKYGRNNSTTDLAGYDRAGYLTRIDYGTRSDTAYGNAPAQVVFTEADRCLANCATRNATTWPDTPYDQECTAAPCTVTTPTFWTTKRLATVTTRIWDAGAGRHTDVESWTLTHSFPDPGDGTRAGLWLDKISHAGHAGPTATVPDVTFVGVQMPNRVDATDHSPPMNWWRVAHINTETGGKIAISYSGADCVAGIRVPTAPESNTLRCYPVRWTPPGYANPVTDYFHKYVVTTVTETDLTGRAPRSITSYDYVGDPAWHYTDDDGLVKAEYKTWSVWRGYGTVRTTKGDPGEQTTTETTYFRGMHGDKLPSGTRAVTLPAAGAAPAVADEDAYSGMTRQTITFNGVSEVGGETVEPWQSAPSASRTLNGVTVHARYTGTLATHTRTMLDAGRPARTTTTRNTLDAYGMVTQVDDAGDTAVTGDETCVRTTYEPRNTTAWLLSYAHRLETYAVPCDTNPASEKEVIGDEKTSYDGQAYGTAPTQGRATQVETLKTWTATDRTYLVTAKSTYDAHGRVLETWDVKGNKSTMAYTPATGGPTTGTTATSPLGWVTTTTLNPAWGSPTKTVDANGRTTELAYDALGRLTQVWLPGRDRSANPSAPSMSYTYLVRKDGPVAVTTSQLNNAGGYTTFHTLYDGLLRPRQTQSPEAGDQGGRIVIDTFYDTAGRAWKTNDAYIANGAPGTALFEPSGDNAIPAQTRKVFDGAGRETASIFLSMGVEKWRTSTGYGGDRLDVTPPSGGTATSTVTNAQGKITALRQYASGTPSGSFDTTGYTYTRKGELEKITDPAGNSWSYGYDLRGRKTTVNDPDKGATTNGYNDAGELVSVTDADGNTLAYTYDAIGRKTGVYDGTVAEANKRAEWVYDSLVKGHLTKSIRYAGGNAYTREITGYTADYKPTAVTYTIPAAETGLAGSYTYEHTYTGNGLAASTRLPDLDGAGGLPAETLTFGYTSLDKPRTLATSIDATTYVDLTAYTRFGELAVIGRRNNNGRIMDTGLYYQEGTRRVERLLTTREITPASVLDINLTYDNAGNITRAADTPAGGTADVQCFGYDNLRRLTEAWTPANGDCAPVPSAAGLGGAATYWHTWTFDKVGNRRTLVEHATAAGDVTTTYTYPNAGAAQPHTLTGTTTTDATGTRAATYTYDKQGNTATRPTPPSGTQKLTWDIEGHLATSIDSTGTTSYLHDADGNRLIRRDPTGRTLYLPDQELRYTTSDGAKAGTRYYSHAGHIIATRTAAGLRWLATDHQGTALVTVHPGTQTITQRRQTPYGTIRGATGTWPPTMDKGFVGGTNDNTGLTHLGAREYDPLIGRFLSVDPVIDHNDPQQLHGYSYSNGNPITMSDPDGQLPNWMSKVGSAMQQQVQAHVNTAKQAVNAVGQVATAAGTRAWEGTKATSKWIYDHSGEIAAVAGVVALVTPPPVNAVAATVGVAFGAMDAYKKCTGQKWVDCGLAVAGMIPGAGIVRAASGIGKARSMISIGKAAIQEADEGMKTAMAGWGAAEILATKSALSPAAIYYARIRGVGRGAVAEGTLWEHRFMHGLHFWDGMEVPILAAKTEFYRCKHVFHACESTLQDTIKPRPRPTWHNPPAKPSAPSGGGSTYAPVTNPWGGGFFE